jgi:hypothetical protein
MSNPKNEALKATAASALARLSRHSPGLIHALVEKYHPLNAFVKTVLFDSSKARQ